jgi:phosphohistidine phosphatase
MTSPLTRAVQTAELLMHEAGKRSCLVANSLLAAEGAHQQIVELIRTSKAASVMLVGHEPLLSQTAALLLGKEQLPGFGKGSCLSLELRDSQAKSKFVWYAPRIGNIVKSLRKFLKESSA